MRFSTNVAVFVLIAAATACAPQTHTVDAGSASPSPSASPVASPSSHPAATATASAVPATPNATVTPGITPAPVPSGAATPAATPSPSVQMAAPDESPRILDVRMNETTVHGGDTVSGTIITSSNVASVEVRIANFSMNMPKDGVGHFSLSYTVPNIPFFLHRTYDMNVIARNTRGDAVTKTIPIDVR